MRHTIVRNANRVMFALLISTSVSACAANQDKQFYNIGDFESVAKIDTHVHINSESTALIEAARANQFQLLTINVDYPDFPAIDEQRRIALKDIAAAPDTVAFSGTFSMAGWSEPEWKDRVIARMQHDLNAGAVAIKVWKNIGMSARNQHGDLIMIDDPSLTPVFSWIAQHDIPLIGHQGEPHNCWLPVEEMSVLNDQSYFSHHPQYHMYLHPEMPSYEAHMAHRDAMLAAHPDLNFVGAHVASIEWSVDKLAEFLERFPNARVDLAARMGQIQVQSQHDYNKVREFFIRYADRILYATDLTQSAGATDEQTLESARNTWLSDWQFLTSDEELSQQWVAGSYQGLHLPRQVIDKIYYHNAVAAFPGAFNNLTVTNAVKGK